MFHGPVPLGHTPGIWLRTLARLETWTNRIRERRALYRLDERARHDLALSAADVEGEAGKPFWRG